jgi:hypothetical protein
MMAGEAIQNARVKRIAVDIYFVFYKMSQFQANELFCDRPFIMLQIDAGCPEKFVRAVPNPGPVSGGACAGCSERCEGQDDQQK